MLKWNAVKFDSFKRKKRFYLLSFGNMSRNKIYQYMYPNVYHLILNNLWQTYKYLPDQFSSPHRVNVLYFYQIELYIINEKRIRRESINFMSFSLIFFGCFKKKEHLIICLIQTPAHMERCGKIPARGDNEDWMT